MPRRARRARAAARAPIDLGALALVLAAVVAIAHGQPEAAVIAACATFAVMILRAWLTFGKRG